jgi:hypothetical protein
MQSTIPVYQFGNSPAFSVRMEKVSALPARRFFPALPLNIETTLLGGKNNSFVG